MEPLHLQGDIREVVGVSSKQIRQLALSSLVLAVPSFLLMLPDPDTTSRKLMSVCENLGRRRGLF